MSRMEERCVCPGDVTQQHGGSLGSESSEAGWDLIATDSILPKASRCRVRFRG